MSTETRSSGGWGCGVLIAIALLVALVGSWREESRKAREVEEAARKAEQVERDLRTFAGQHLPELQQVIDEIGEEIATRQAKLDELAAEFRRLQVSPDTDPDYVRWSTAVYRLQLRLEELKAERRDAYLALKKYELSPDLTTDARIDRERRLEKARAAARDGRKLFEELIRKAENRDAL